MSDTPRTDAEWNQCYDSDYGTNGISQEFARQLERELNEANARLKQLQEVARAMYDLLLPCGCNTHKCQTCFMQDQYNALPDDVKGKVE